MAQDPKNPKKKIAELCRTKDIDLFPGSTSFFSKEKINPMIGAAGISAFPMSARVLQKMALEEDKSNFLLMHSVGVNVSGQIASVIAGGLILSIVQGMIG